MGKGGSTNTTIRYAKYLEDAHKDLMDTVHALLAPAVALNPYTGYEGTDAIDIEDAFFGAGYTLSSFPSLYDMFGKFMAGLDVEVLFDQEFEDTVNGTVVNNMIGQEAIRLEDEIDQVSAPRMELGMRDMNSVMSSTFVIGRTLLENEKTKALARYSAEVKLGLVPVATERWKAHLMWNQTVVKDYAEILKLYVMMEKEVVSFNLDLKTKNAMWPFGIYDFDRVLVGTFSGATNQTTKKESSWLGSLVSGLGMAAMFL